MKLYYSKGACSLAVRITLHELGLTAEYEAVDLKTKKTDTGADFLAINPKGAVPVLLTTENAILTENTAIQQYLADSNEARKLLPLVGDFARYQVIEWLGFINSDVHKSFGPLFNPNMPSAIKEEFFVPLLKNKLNFIEKKLGDKDFLMGDDFTIADAYLFVMLLWLKHVKLEIANWPNLARYFENVKQRKAVVAALSEEGLV